MSHPLIIEPEIVAEQRKQKERQHQLERRGIARELMAAHIQNARSYMVEDLVNSSLELADALLAATKVE